MTTSELQLVQLRNGTQDIKEYVESISILLKKLYTENQLLFYGLVMICRNAEYKPFGTTKQLLKELMLLENDGLPSNSVKNIVLSSVDNSMKFISPIVE